MKEILVVPRHFMKELIKIPRDIKTPWALISIYSTFPDKFVNGIEMNSLMKMNCNNVLSLCFKDLTPENSLRIENPGLFDEAHAYKIKDFVDDLVEKGIKRLLVHCDAGISRSGAVGLWACRYIGLDEKEFMKKNPNIGPNSHVYNTLYVISGMRKSYQDFWDQEASGRILTNEDIF